MYTEVFLRAELRLDDPVILDVAAIVGGLALTPKEPHPFFTKERWRNVFTGGSAYFPAAPKSELKYGVYSGEGPTLVVHANLTNYDGEIEAFFDWIDSHIEARYGEFIGYSLYEDVQQFTGPTLYYKGGRHA